MGLSTDSATHLKFPCWLQRWCIASQQESTTTGTGISLFELAILFSTLIQGMNNIVTKLLLLHFHPWVFLMLCNGLGVVIGWLLLWFQDRQQLRHLLRAWKPFFLPGVLGRGLSAICWSLGLTYSSASNAALIACSTPIFTTLYMVLTKQERMTGRGWAGIAFAVSGIYLVITKGKGLALTENFYGNLLILLGSLTWSYYLIMVKKWIGEKHPVTHVTVLSMTTSLTLLIPGGASQLYAQEWLTIPSLTWGLLGYMVIGSTILASLLWTWGVTGIGLCRTMIYQYLTPVIAVIGGWVILGEPITKPKLLGGFLVLSGIYLARQR